MNSSSTPTRRHLTAEAAGVGLLLIIVGLTGFLALPRWMWVWSGVALAAGFGLVLMTAVVVRRRVRRTGEKPSMAKSGDRFGKSTIRAGSVVLPVGALLLWLIGWAGFGPSVIGAWSIGSSPTVTSARLKVHDCNKCSDEVTYVFQGRTFHEHLSASLAGGRRSGPAVPVVLDPEAPSHVMLHRDWRFGRHPATVAALALTNLIPIAVLVRLGWVLRTRLEVLRPHHDTAG